MTGSLSSPAMPTMTLHTASTLLEVFPLPPALASFVVNVQKGKFSTKDGSDSAVLW